MSESKLLRFVILKHDHPFLHWDLLMENDDQTALKAWRLLQKPERNKWIASELLPDHRMLYLDYEGPVSHDRGTVVQHSCGQYRPAELPEGPDRSTFLLINCDFATKLIGRGDSTSAPSWRFE